MGLFFFGILLSACSVFLMLLILVQRGKGGGLTGALGGMGGQSAFGAKAGDAFTKITTVTSIVWITLCMLTIAFFNKPPTTEAVLKKKKELVGTPTDTAGISATADPKEDDGNAGDDATPNDDQPADDGNTLDIEGDNAGDDNEPAAEGSDDNADEEKK